MSKTLALVPGAQGIARPTFGAQGIARRTFGARGVALRGAVLRGIARVVLPVAVLTVALGCGGSAGSSPSEVPTAEPEMSAAAPTTSDAKTPATSEAKAADGAIPTDCTKKGDLCVPQNAFVNRLCSNVNPDLALVYFRAGTPFTRGYLKGNTDAWNASGGVSSPDKLVFDEEVIVLRARENKTGIEVSGASGGYDVLRWDGSCATLSDGEMTLSPAPKPKNAAIDWKVLSDEAQAILLGDEKIAKINKTRRDECKGASMGEVSRNCVKAVSQLSDAVAEFVRRGGELPLPAKLR